MVLNRFNMYVFIQVLLIAGTGLLFSFAVRTDFMRMTSAGLLIIWVGQILFLTWYINRIHRDVGRFINALRNQDTSQHFSWTKGGAYFQRLYAAFEEISRDFRFVRIEKEVENQFFREIIQQSALGIMAINEDGSIRLINKAALELLNVEILTNLKKLSQRYPDFRDIVSEPKAETHHQLKIVVDGKLVHLAVKTTDILMQGNRVRIYFMSDISREMAWNEVETWQKLIRVLNHEIANSVSPIHVLSTSLYEQFHHGKKRKVQDEIDERLIERTIEGLQAIIRRSGGLSDFIDKFRNFTNIGVPDYSPVRIRELLKQIKTIMSAEISNSGAEFSVEVIPADLEVLADEKLIEQVVINLVQNAIQATGDTAKPMIWSRGYQTGKQVCLEISDNGKGIPGDMLDLVFTPFFTTRKDGSGIGLSLARQVMQMHHGSISVRSEEGSQTTFTLSF
jgi:two-component system, NtrC family, nitrogen regulation sensor histidine kinase NtrY